MALTTPDRQLPYLALQKRPVSHISELWISYPDGGEFGWYAFVGDLKTFVYWDVDSNRWEEIANSNIGSNFEEADY